MKTIYDFEGNNDDTSNKLNYEPIVDNLKEKLDNLFEKYNVIHNITKLNPEAISESSEDIVNILSKYISDFNDRVIKDLNIFLSQTNEIRDLSEILNDLKSLTFKKELQDLRKKTTELKEIYKVTERIAFCKNKFVTIVNNVPKICTGEDDENTFFDKLLQDLRELIDVISQVPNGNFDENIKTKLYTYLQSTVKTLVDSYDFIEQNLFNFSHDDFSNPKKVAEKFEKRRNFLSQYKDIVLKTNLKDFSTPVIASRFENLKKEQLSYDNKLIIELQKYYEEVITKKNEEFELGYNDLKKILDLVKNFNLKSIIVPEKINASSVDYFLNELKTQIDIFYKDLIDLVKKFNDGLSTLNSKYKNDIHQLEMLFNEYVKILPKHIGEKLHLIFADVVEKFNEKWADNLENVESNIYETLLETVNTNDDKCITELNKILNSYCLGFENAINQKVELASNLETLRELISNVERFQEEINKVQDELKTKILQHRKELPLEKHWTKLKEISINTPKLSNKLAKSFAENLNSALIGQMNKKFEDFETNLSLTFSSIRDSIQKMKNFKEEIFGIFNQYSEEFSKLKSKFEYIFEESLNFYLGDVKRLKRNVINCIVKFIHNSDEFVTNWMVEEKEKFLEDFNKKFSEFFTNFRIRCDEKLGNSNILCIFEYLQDLLNQYIKNFESILQEIDNSCLTIKNLVIEYETNTKKIMEEFRKFDFLGFFKIPYLEIQSIIESDIFKSLDKLSEELKSNFFDKLESEISSFFSTKLSTVIKSVISNLCKVIYQYSKKNIDLESFVKLLKTWFSTILFVRHNVNEALEKVINYLKKKNDDISVSKLLNPSIWECIKDFTDCVLEGILNYLENYRMNKFRPGVQQKEINTIMELMRILANLLQFKRKLNKTHKRMLRSVLTKEFLNLIKEHDKNLYKQFRFY